MSTNLWIPLSLSCVTTEESRQEFLTYASRLNKVDAIGSEKEQNVLEEEMKSALQGVIDTDIVDRQALVSAIHVLTDLARQGWKIRNRNHQVEVLRPASWSKEPLEEKRRVRKQLLAERNQQLRQPATQAFIRSMEQRRIFDERFVSIFSLMRDGRELSDQLRILRESDEKAVCGKGSDTVIQPYLQIIDGDKRCEWTGLRLLDIWRYFRHTWSNAYNSIPGRTMLILVRDSAVKFHPVIGIAALSSPAVQIRKRDEWLEWSSDVFLCKVREQPTLKVARWLCRITDQAIEEIYKNDLLEDSVINLEQLRNPGEDIVKALEREAAEQREKHHRFMEATAYKKIQDTDKRSEASWESQARSPLFRSKRSETLARMLRVRSVLRQFFGQKPTKEKLRQLLQSSVGKRTLHTVVRKAKADRVGVALADISVCGAIPPYNEILGGKLVSMLLTSAEVIKAYQNRYEKAQSIIASSMAGRPVIRPPRLVCLTTTSLYGIGSSQYNRIVLPCEKIGGGSNEEIRYRCLGSTEGFGTGQFGPATARALTRLVEQSDNGQRVNSIFGEGVSPRLRKIRDGLTTLGFPSDELLVHGSHRIVYGIPLARNFREYLLGIDERPKYSLPMKNPALTTQRISSWWSERWLMRRIQNDEILERVTRHTLVYPIQHGARVPAIPANPDQLELLEETNETE